MSKTSPKRVLIVGAGLTGSMLSQLLRRGTAAAAAHPDNSVSVWDKSRGSGGRAGTSRVSSSGAKGDLGLQYLSTSPNPDTGEIHPMYSQLVDAGVIAPMGCRLVGMNPKYVDPTKQHFVAVEGASSLAKHFLNTDGVDVSYSKTVTAIARAPTAEDSGGSSGWVVSTSDDDGGSAPEVFDSVVLTAPMPQVLAMGGDVQDLITAAGVRSKLEAVTYSSRWALAVEFPPAAWEAVSTLQWDARYVNKDEDAAVCYLSIDRGKRGKLPSTAAAGPVLVVHTGVPWSLQHFSAVGTDEEPEGYRATVEADIMEHVKGLVPELFGTADGDAGTPYISTKLHKWRYSQIHKPMEGTPKAIAISDSPLFVLAGDAFTGSNFDNCRSSAEKAFDLLSSHL